MIEVRGSNAKYRPSLQDFWAVVEGCPVIAGYMFLFFCCLMIRKAEELLVLWPCKKVHVVEAERHRMCSNMWLFVIIFILKNTSYLCVRTTWLSVAPKRSWVAAWFHGLAVCHSLARPWNVGRRFGWCFKTFWQQLHSMRKVRCGASVPSPFSTCSFWTFFKIYSPCWTPWMWRPMPICFSFEFKPAKLLWLVILQPF